ncbi:hypothetical protein H1C71_011845 [Ictidomys tridecemlineatus]|nr:hypothetical protein H1C71_011845 [Ictidomys tridecemlineatus]
MCQAQQSLHRGLKLPQARTPGTSEPGAERGRGEEGAGHGLPALASSCRKGWPEPGQKADVQLAMCALSGPAPAAPQPARKCSSSLPSCHSPALTVSCERQGGHSRMTPSTTEKADQGVAGLPGLQKPSETALILPGLSHSSDEETEIQSSLSPSRSAPSRGGQGIPCHPLTIIGSPAVP